MADNERGLLDAVMTTYESLDRWQAAATDGSYPAEDSELASDDLAWPYMRSSTTAIACLAAATEQLHAIRLLLHTREAFPSAWSTLARTTLVGAAAAVWMLSPDDRDERLRRSLSIVRHDYTEAIKHHELAQRILPPEDIRPEGPDELDRRRLRRTQVQSLLDGLGGGYNIDLTNIVIPAAVEASWNLTPQQRRMILLQWRSMSGAVHALLWQHHGYPGTVTTDIDELGVGRTVVTGDVDQLVMAYFSGYHVARRGWPLYARRAGVDI